MCLCEVKSAKAKVQRRRSELLTKNENLRYVLSVYPVLTNILPTTNSIKCS